MASVSTWERIERQNLRRRERRIRRYRPGDRPDSSRPAGTDVLPQIKHIVVLMMENHSFDNYLGTLGRGEGFPLGDDGTPDAENPDSAGTMIRAYHASSTVQGDGVPCQSWSASHTQWAAVVVNPTKLDDDEAFRKAVRRVMDDHGWDEPLWLETTPEDPGRGQAESAVSAGIGLVLACGGDGTVTACAEGITGTGVPLAIIPMGTGNLLARNIGLPMGLEEARSVHRAGGDAGPGSAVGAGRRGYEPGPPAHGGGPAGRPAAADAARIGLTP